MTFQFGKTSNRALTRGSRNKDTIVLLALLPDPLGENPSDAAIRRYAIRVDRALARLAPNRNAARRGRRSAGPWRGRVVLQRGKSGRWACKEQAKYKRGRVAAQRAARSSPGRSGRK
jgi:hypothetical protein